MKKLATMFVLAVTGCTTIPNSSLDYDWYYSSSVEESYDKFEDVSTISISPIDAESYSNGVDPTNTQAKISFHYHYKKDAPPSFAYLTVIVDSANPQLESSDLKFEKDGKFHQGSLVRYKKYPRQVGRGSIGTYGSSYHETTRFVEAANYRFEVSELCPFDRLEEFEFKAGEIYKLSQGYSVSLSHWCERIRAETGQFQSSTPEARP